MDKLKRITNTLDLAIDQAKEIIEVAENEKKTKNIHETTNKIVERTQNLLENVISLYVNAYINLKQSLSEEQHIDILKKELEARNLVSQLKLIKCKELHIER